METWIAFSIAAGITSYFVWRDRRTAARVKAPKKPS